MIRIGLLGASAIAPLAMVGPAARRRDCEVVCIGARCGTRARQFADTHHIPDAVEGYEALIAREDIDLIYNGLMHNRHADLSIAAVEAGKAVLCEKPFAMNAGEAGAMVAASERTGLPIIEGFHYRHHPAWPSFREAVAGLGKLHRLEGCFRVGLPEDSTRRQLGLGGGALMDLGCYVLDALHQLAGRQGRVLSATAREASPGVDGAMVADLEFGEVPARMDCDMDADTREMSITATGELGTLRIDGFVHPYRGYALTRDGDRSERPPTERTTFDHQLAHVLKTMAVGEAAGASARDGLATMRAIDAVYRAAGMRPRGQSVDS